MCCIRCAGLWNERPDNFDYMKQLKQAIAAGLAFSFHIFRTSLRRNIEFAPDFCILISGNQAQNDSGLLHADRHRSAVSASCILKFPLIDCALLSQFLHFVLIFPLISWACLSLSVFCSPWPTGLFRTRKYVKLTGDNRRFVSLQP